MPSVTLRPTQGQSLHHNAMGDTALACFGRIPWIDCQGVQQAGRGQSDNVNDDGGNGNSMTRMVATMATMTKVMWTAMAAATTTTTLMTLTLTTRMMGQGQCDGDDEDGTTTI